jgi:hypothetical protein
MATASVTYYHGETKLHTITSERKEKAIERFPNQKRFVKNDSFSVMVGWLPEMDCFKNRGEWVPATRRIFFKKNPSLHKCDARCQNAKGHDCECSCGGANHGKNA